MLMTPSFVICGIVDETFLHTHYYAIIEKDQRKITIEKLVFMVGYVHSKHSERVNRKATGLFSPPSNQSDDYCILATVRQSARFA